MALPPTDQPEPPPRTTALSLNIKDTSVLHSAYMPYVKGGAIFIPTSKSYGLGDEIFMLIVLPGDTARLPVAGKVCWVTPTGAQGSRPAGIGVQFADTAEGEAVRGKIETTLAGTLNSDKPTQTM